MEIDFEITFRPWNTPQSLPLTGKFDKLTDDYHNSTVGWSLFKSLHFIMYN
jgi:hypothetical protein